MSAAFLRDEVVRIAAMIAIARRMVEAGAPVDLTPVGLGIDNLCKSVMRLPTTEGIKLRDDLNNLTARLERLGDDIEARHAARLQGEFAPELALVDPPREG
jgi:hypothetical protein